MALLCQQLENAGALESDKSVKEILDKLDFESQNTKKILLNKSEKIK